MKGVYELFGLIYRYGGFDAYVPTPIIRSIVLSFSRVVDSSIRGMVTGFVVVAGR